MRDGDRCIDLYINHSIYTLKDLIENLSFQTTSKTFDQVTKPRRNKWKLLVCVDKSPNFLFSRLNCPLGHINLRDSAVP